MCSGVARFFNLPDIICYNLGRVLKMRFHIKGIIEKYPAINIGVLIGKDLRIKESNPELEKYKEESLLIAEDQVSCSPITRHEFIASWRDVYRSFGSKPGDYRPSAEALVRRALKKQSLPKINTAVDTYNSVSIRYMIPMGGFDTDLVEGDIELRFSQGGEVFQPLGSVKIEHTYEGEVVYADRKRILTRRWNYRDCDQTKITKDTVNIVMFIDGSPEIPRGYIEKALGELAINLKSYCDGSYSTSIADSRTPEILIK
jgi:DNA/RNA-binding domain of Phe-tRNA-synthetase-like protein